MLEDLSEQTLIDLFYGDETQVSTTGYVPYAWQFQEEDLAIKVQKGKGLNCFGLLSRDGRFYSKTTEDNINTDFVIKFLNEFSKLVSKPTVIVLDNASVHKAKKLLKCLEKWQQNNLFIFYLPPYSPHLNIIERLWKEMKQTWIKPEYYENKNTLFEATKSVLNKIGHELKMTFKKFEMDIN